MLFFKSFSVTLIHNHILTPVLQSSALSTNMCIYRIFNSPTIGMMDSLRDSLCHKDPSYGTKNLEARARAEFHFREVLLVAK